VVSENRRLFRPSFQQYILAERRKKMKNTKWGLVPIVIMLALGRASYAEIGPKKPSSLVTMWTSFGCAQFASASQFLFRIMPDGNSVPFAVPENQVLIVTDVDWQNSSGDGNQPRTDEASLFLLNGSEPSTFLAKNVATGITETVGGSFHFEHGIAVSSRVAICISLTSGGTVSARLHGYLTKDK
jgi:hypothetical protein